MVLGRRNRHPSLRMRLWKEEGRHTHSAIAIAFQIRKRMFVYKDKKQQEEQSLYTSQIDSGSQLHARLSGRILRVAESHATILLDILLCEVAKRRPVHGVSLLLFSVRNAVDTAVMSRLCFFN
jgi:hypothetical protein